MRLSGGLCACCARLTSSSVLWAGHSRFLRVWCCDAHVLALGEDVRQLLTLAACDAEKAEAARVAC